MSRSICLPRKQPGARNERHDDEADADPRDGNHEQDERADERERDRSQGSVPDEQEELTADRFEPPVVRLRGAAKFRGINDEWHTRKSIRPIARTAQTTKETAMPKFTVKPENDYPMAVSSPAGKNKKRYPTVTIPASKEIIAALTVGGPVVVELTGIVQKLQSSQAVGGDSYDNRTEIRVELRQVEAYPSEAAEEAAEADEPGETMQGAISKGLKAAAGKAK